MGKGSKSARQEDSCHRCLNRGNLHNNNQGAAFVALLRACTKAKDLCSGSKVHGAVMKRGLLQKCSDALVTMYVKCGELAKAKALLNTHKARHVSSWTALIAGCVQKGHADNALCCFDQMCREGLSPDAVTFASMLKACGIIKASEKGKQIHDEIARQGLLRSDIVLGNALVDMYAKCGSFMKAHEVLQELPVRDVVSWNALIAACAQQDQTEQALNCFGRMQQEGIPPNAVTFCCMLRACASIKAADQGARVHDEITRQGLLKENTILGNALVDMYAKCGALSKARRVLEELRMRNVVSWSALITGYSQEGQGEEALLCLEQMAREGVSPDAAIFSCILKACANIGAVDKGEQIHDEIARQGLLENNMVLCHALVDMYAKCGSLVRAQHVLEDLCMCDVVSWNSVIAGYAQQGQGEQALNCLKQMQCKGVVPDRVTLLHVLKDCRSTGATVKGEQLLDVLAGEGLLQSSTVLGTALVDMYAKCGDLTKAAQVLGKLPTQDVVSWSAFLGACQRRGDAYIAKWAFEHAVRVDKSDAAAYVLTASIYAASSLLEDAKTIEPVWSENR